MPLVELAEPRGELRAQLRARDNAHVWIPARAARRARQRLAAY